MSNIHYLRDGERVISKEELLRVVEKIAPLYRDWTFIAFSPTKFKVEAYGQRLADLELFRLGSRRWKTAEQTFTLSSPRIKKLFSTKNYYETASEGRLIGKFKKYVYPNTAEETLHRGRSSLHSLQRDLSAEMKKFITGDVAGCIPTLTDEEITSVTEFLSKRQPEGDSLISKLRTYLPQRSVLPRHKSGHYPQFSKGVLVVKNCMQEGYVTQKMDQGELVGNPLTANTLDYEHTRKIGLLKMSEKGTCIHGVGVQVSEDTFYILT